MTDPTPLALFVGVVYGLIGTYVSARTDSGYGVVVGWPVVALVAAVGLFALWAAADEVS